MDVRAPPPREPRHPDAVEFVRFCYRRRRVGWPELYDEMCAVAGRGLFRGCGAEDLAAIGIGFGLFEMPALAALVRRVVAEEHALRRPMTVVLPRPQSPAPPSRRRAGRPAAAEDAIGFGRATASFDVPIHLGLARPAPDAA